MPFSLLLYLSFLAHPIPQQPSAIQQPLDRQLPDKPKGFVTDAAHVLSITERALLEKRCARINHRHLAQIGIVLVTSLNGEPIEDASLQLSNKWGIGRKGINDGILIMLAIQDRKSRLEVGRGLEQTVTNDNAAKILDAMRPDLRKASYAAALSLALDNLTDLLSKR